MEVLLGCFSENELKNINKVRISLQLPTLADITMRNGRTLLPDIYKAISHRKSSLCWPRQPLITKFLRLWNQACQHLQRHLHAHTLGHWKSTHKKWEWSTNNENNLLKHHYQIYTKLPRRGQKCELSNNIGVHQFEMHPVDISMVNDKIKLISPVCIVTPSIERNQHQYSE